MDKIRQGPWRLLLDPGQECKTWAPVTATGERLCDFFARAARPPEGNEWKEAPGPTFKNWHSGTPED